MGRFILARFLLVLFMLSVFNDAPALELITSEEVIGNESVSKKDRLIAGVVTDKDGTPLTDVSINVECHITELGPGRYQWTFKNELDLPIVTTDIQGRFSIDLKDGGWCCLLFIREGFEDTVIYDIPAGQTDLNVRLDKGGTVTGQVVYILDGRKVPLPNFPVQAETSQGRGSLGNTDPYAYFGIRNQFETKTDSDGRFRFQNLSTKRRDTLKVRLGDITYEKRDWRVSGGGLYEMITFNEDGENKFIEFIMDDEIKVAVCMKFSEVLYGVNMDLENAIRIHDLIVQFEDNTGVIPSVEELLNRPRSTLARYLKNGLLNRNEANSLLNLLCSIGLVKIWNEPQSFVSEGEYDEITLTGQWYLIGYSQFKGWATIGYPGIPKISFVTWPDLEKDEVHLSLDVNSWCGIQRESNGSICIENLRSVTFSKETTVSSDELMIIPLWKHKSDGDIREDEDLFFVMMEAHICRPRASSEKINELHKASDKATSERSKVKSKPVARIKGKIFFIVDQFLKKLIDKSPSQDGLSDTDIEMLHEIAEKISQGEQILLDDAQAALLMNEAEKYRNRSSLLDMSVREGVLSCTGNYEGATYISGYWFSDEYPDEPIKDEDSFFLGLWLGMRASVPSEDEIELEGTLCLTNLKRFEEKQFMEGYNYKIPIVYQEVHSISGLSESWDKTVVFKT